MRRFRHDGTAILDDNRWIVPALMGSRPSVRCRSSRRAMPERRWHGAAVGVRRTNPPLGPVSASGRSGPKTPQRGGAGRPLAVEGPAPLFWAPQLHARPTNRPVRVGARAGGPAPKAPGGFFVGWAIGRGGGRSDSEKPPCHLRRQFVIQKRFHGSDEYGGLEVFSRFRRRQGGSR